MSAANGTQRDIGLDLTRILAFLAVPSVHFFLNSTYYDTAIVGPRMALMTVMRTAFMVCVPLYMLLSGYLSAGKHIPLTRSGLLGYYKKLLPIFLTYALSTGVILLYRVLWLGEEQTIRSAVKNLLSFQQYSWYMNMYFGLLLLTPFLNALWQSLATPAARRALLAVLLVLTVLPGMVNIYNLHSAETLLHPWLSTSYDQLVPDWWQRLYPITYYFLGGYLRAHVDIKRLRTGRLAALLLLAVLCFGGYNVWRNQGIPFVWGSWCDWGSLQNVVDTVLVFLLLNSIRYSTPPYFHCTLYRLSLQADPRCVSGVVDTGQLPVHHAEICRPLGDGSAELLPPDGGRHHPRLPAAGRRGGVLRLAADASAPPLRQGGNRRHSSGIG